MNKPPVWAIASVSAIALGYEVLLIRLLSIVQWHHFAYMIISLALLGFGASGSYLFFRFAAINPAELGARFAPRFLRYILCFALTITVCFYAAQTIPFHPEELLWDATQALTLAAMYMLLAVPFFFAANAIGLALYCYGPHIPRIYAFDLAGAGAGATIIVLLLYGFFPQRVVLIFSAAGCLAALVAAWELRYQSAIVTVLAATGVAVCGMLPSSWINLAISPYKNLPQTMQIKGAAVTAQLSSPLGLLTVVENPLVPFRYAPGAGLLLRQEPPRQAAVFTDGDTMTVINKADAHNARFLLSTTQALPYILGHKQEVLVLAAGGGTDVLQARLFGSGHIDAVELNPQLVWLLSGPYRQYSGDLYSANVDVHITDARAYVHGVSRRYDLIQIALAASGGGGLHPLSENYLYTQEAVSDYWSALNPAGVLAVTLWLDLPPRDTIKWLNTVITVLRNKGVQNPGAHILMIRSWQTATVLLKKSPFTLEEIQSARNFCDENLFDTAYYPGMRPEQANRHNRLDRAYFFEAATALLAERTTRQAYLERYKFDLVPATDDRPYFNHFFKWSTFLETLRLRGQGGLPLVEWAYVVLWLTLLQAIVFSVLFIALPLVFRRVGAESTSGDILFVLIYFGLLGLAFMFMEMAFVQKYMMFLYHPVLAAATVLSGFLVFAGLGSRFAQRERRRSTRFLPAAVSSLCITAVVVWYAQPFLFQLLHGWPLPARMFAAVLEIAPLAFFMGMPFPYALHRLHRQRPRLVPLAWGVNGCTSVIAAVAAMLLAVHAGFHAVVMVALSAYLGALAGFVLWTRIPITRPLGNQRESEVA